MPTTNTPDDYPSDRLSSGPATTIAVTLHLTAEEHAAWLAAADAQPLDVWIRKRCSRKRTPRVATPSQAAYALHALDGARRSTATELVYARRMLMRIMATDDGSESWDLRRWIEQELQRYLRRNRLRARASHVPHVRSVLRALRTDVAPLSTTVLDAYVAAATAGSADCDRVARQLLADAIDAQEATP